MQASLYKYLDFGLVIIAANVPIYAVRVYIVNENDDYFSISSFILFLCLRINANYFNTDK